MPSPFPGMNPYFEEPSVWTDFHNTFLGYFREALHPAVAPRYFVRVEEHIYLRELDDDDDDTRRRAGISDLHVADREATRPAPGGTVVLTPPARAVLPRYTRERLTFLEVRDRNDRSVVTVIEMLSPSNKVPGLDRERFLDKRRGLLTSRANYVELDFLRGGPRLPLRSRPPCDYYAMVSRPDARPGADIWPIRLRLPLPVIPIPLRPGETEPLIDLQAVLHRTYDGGGYAQHIYFLPPDPPLAPPDDAWAADVARAATPAT